MGNLPEPARRFLAAASIVAAGFLLFGVFARTVSRELAELKIGPEPRLRAAITPAPPEENPTLSPAAGITESFRSAFDLLGRLGQSESGFWAALGSRRDAARAAAGEALAGFTEWVRWLAAREVEP